VGREGTVYLVGLTGGIASGKTLVRRVFKELGAKTIDADDVSRELTAPGTPAAEAVLREFGPAYFLPDGTLDRKGLAEVVFADEEKRRRLEAILHPLIGDTIAARVEAFAARDPDAVIVVDAALLIETGMTEIFDAVVVVYADVETRVARLMARDGVSRHAAHLRINAQMPLERKLDLADFVVDNNALPEDARREAMGVYNRLLGRAAAKG
jgi:dephospho-CoA kinase